MKDFHINVDKLVHLKDTENFKVLVDEKEFHFVEGTGVFDTIDDKFHYF
jgi:hypothetical protein